MLDCRLQHAKFHSNPPTHSSSILTQKLSPFIVFTRYFTTAPYLESFLMFITGSSKKRLRHLLKPRGIVIVVDCFGCLFAWWTVVLTDMSMDPKVGSMIPEDLSTNCSIGSMIQSDPMVKFLSRSWIPLDPSVMFGIGSRIRSDP